MNPEYLLLTEVPIMKEYDTFIQYTIDKGILLTRTKELMGGKALSELNEEMTYPVPDVTNKHPQYRFHLLNFFYHLSLGGLMVKKEKKGGHLYFTPTQKALEYLTLHPVEKYFFLLETLFIYMDWDFIQEYNNSSAFSHFNLYLYCISQERVGEVIHLKDAENTMFRYLHSSGYLAPLLSSLGFIRIVGELYYHPNYKRDVYLDAIVPTSHGAFLGPIIAEERRLSHWNWPNYLSLNHYKRIEDFLSEKEEEFLEPFLDHYPSLNETLVYETDDSIDRGTYVFSIYIQDHTWRRIQMPYHRSLHDLYEIIKESFNLVYDSSFAFIFPGPTKERICYTYPKVEGCPEAMSTLLGEISLYPKKTFTLYYHLYKEHEFFITVESFKEGEEYPPKILGGEGEIV